MREHARLVIAGSVRWIGVVAAADVALAPMLFLLSADSGVAPGMWSIKGALGLSPSPLLRRHEAGRGGGVHRYEGC